MSVTLAQIVDGVRDTLATAVGIDFAQGSADLTEAMLDLPTVQVYWERIDNDAAQESDRTTFGGGVRQKEITLHADVYARQRSHLDEDMAALLALSDAIADVLEAQNSAPLFGVAAIKAFRWSAERVTFTYADVSYVGSRFVIAVRVV